MVEKTKSPGDRGLYKRTGSLVAAMVIGAGSLVGCARADQSPDWPTIGPSVMSPEEVGEPLHVELDRQMKQVRDDVVERTYYLLSDAMPDPQLQPVPFSAEDQSLQYLDRIHQGVEGDRLGATLAVEAIMDEVTDETTALHVYLISYVNNGEADMVEPCETIGVQDIIYPNQPQFEALRDGELSWPEVFDLMKDSSDVEAFFMNKPDKGAGLATSVIVSREGDSMTISTVQSSGHAASQANHQQLLTKELFGWAQEMYEETVDQMEARTGR